jgi:hypothetical protein
VCIIYPSFFDHRSPALPARCTYSNSIIVRKSATARTCFHRCRARFAFCFACRSRCFFALKKVGWNDALRRVFSTEWPTIFYRSGSGRVRSKEQEEEDANTRRSLFLLCLAYICILLLKTTQHKYVGHAYCSTVCTILHVLCFFEDTTTTLTTCAFKYQW